MSEGHVRDAALSVLLSMILPPSFLVDQCSPDAPRTWNAVLATERQLCTATSNRGPLWAVRRTERLRSLLLTHTDTLAITRLQWRLPPLQVELLRMRLFHTHLLHMVIPLLTLCQLRLLHHAPRLVRHREEREKITGGLTREHAERPFGNCRQDQPECDRSPQAADSTRSAQQLLVPLIASC